jgi:hypothetical protein
MKVALLSPNGYFQKNYDKNLGLKIPQNFLTGNKLPYSLN